MTNRRILAAAFGLLGLLGLLGFWRFFLFETPGRPDSISPTPSSATKREIVVAVNDMRNPLSAELSHSIMRLIADTENLQAVVLDAKGSDLQQKEQLQQLDTSSTTTIAGLILLPVNMVDLAIPIYYLGQAGVPVVTLNYTPISGDVLSAPVVDICFDALQAGSQQAEYCAGLLGSAGKVLLLAGPQGQAVTRQMIAGVRNTLRSHPDIEIVDILYGDWSRTSGRANMEAALAAHEDITAVIAQNDEMLLGALPLITEKGARMVLIGSGATAEGLQAVDEGFLDATISINSRKMARLAFDTVMAAILGVPIRNEVLQTQLITRANLDTYVQEVWNVK